MSQENVKAFRRGTEAYDRRDVDALLKELDPEVEWHSAFLIPHGKAIRIWTYLDPQEALEAAGLSA